MPAFLHPLVENCKLADNVDDYMSYEIGASFSTYILSFVYYHTNNTRTKIRVIKYLLQRLET